MNRFCKHCSEPIYLLNQFDMWMHHGTKSLICDEGNMPLNEREAAEPIDEGVLVLRDEVSNVKDIER